MLDIFSGLRLVVKRRSINIDNPIFRCHWFFTAILLVSFSLIITARQYVGQPIECHSSDKIPDTMLNSYCWVQSTFTVPQACNYQGIGSDVPYPCIDNTRGRDIKIFAYYQWVGIVLFIQGLLFHLPYYLWKFWENGLIKAITGGLRVSVLNVQERNTKKDIVVEYINAHLGCHKHYALKYFLCEFICLINLLGQLWATNRFFDGQFLRYGLYVIEFSCSSMSSDTNKHEDHAAGSGAYSNSSSGPSTALSRPVGGANNVQFTKQKVDPMTYIFPRMTKCNYYDFGPSGDVQKHDALCLLPLNIINEKIYIVLWFWFSILAILTILVIIYRLFAFFSQNVRCKGLISRCKLCSENDIRFICKHCDVGDWFLFYMVAENLDPLIMREIVAAIANKMYENIELKRVHQSQREMEEFEAERRRLIMEVQYRQQMGEFSGGSFSRSTEADSCDAMPRRRNALLPGEQEPIFKRLKRRISSRRVFSLDFESVKLRRRLFGPARSGSLGNNEDSRTVGPIRGPSGAYNQACYSGGAHASNNMEPASAPQVLARPLQQPRLGQFRKPSACSSGVSSSGSSEVFPMHMSPGYVPSPCMNELNSEKSIRRANARHYDEGRV